MRPFFEVPEFHAFLSPAFAEHLLQAARAVHGVPDLKEVGRGGGLETPDALRFLCDLYDEVRPELARVLRQRTADRKFIDARSPFTSVLGLEDARGRVVMGPLRKDFHRAGGPPIAPLPEFLKGPHVTLFGPPDSAKLSINAMNAYHRRLPGEPAIVAELLAAAPTTPMWGADDEDSKTPLRQDLIEAGQNLAGCFDGTLALDEGGKSYRLAADHLSLPIKRFPGLAMPSAFLFLRRNPIPLHLYDFALHLFRCWRDPRALVFYVPKLENEEEARYLARMIAAAERRIQSLHPEYVLGSVRLMIVLENPRAILRAHEIMDALHPYFAGASLGWHDYLASTARLYKNDPRYRIPVKADPDIVIKYIQASHRLLADVVRSRGGIAVGGMYGILPLAGEPRSMHVALRGFIRDVVTQLKRELDGFWVAHPDFVRMGLALVEAWRRHRGGDSAPLDLLIRELLPSEYHAELLAFARGPDVQGWDPDAPNYVQQLLVTDVGESNVIANNHEDEVRYNVFQMLQYLADWLGGNGCVALPTQVAGVPVRVMDDLATAERSRWEVWHEVRHGRFAAERLVEIVHEEMNFIRRGRVEGGKVAQVRWDERTARWYPIAVRVTLALMTDPEPPEFATEWLLPFTTDFVRAAPDPWAAVVSVDPARFQLPGGISKFHRYFEACGAQRFASQMAAHPVEDLFEGERLVMSFTRAEVLRAAEFHGDIGQSKGTLDAQAAREQAAVAASSESDPVLSELRALGARYRERFGFKFLTSAAGRSAPDMLAELRERLNHDEARELDAARRALWTIARKRLDAHPSALNVSGIESIRTRSGVMGLGVAVASHGHIQSIALGSAGSSPVLPSTYFEIASLSKTIATAFAWDFLSSRGLSFDEPVQSLLERSGSPFRLQSAGRPEWAEQVRVRHLVSHSALNMHYVHGFPAGSPVPPVLELLEGKHGYEPVRVISEPGTEFRYSGGGFLLLQHLIEQISGRSVPDLMRGYLDRMGLQEIEFGQPPAILAHGFLDSGEPVPGGHLQFPAFAAGAYGTARAVARFLQLMEAAYHDLDGASGISHDAAVEMLHGVDLGSREFMGCSMGLGVFTAEAEANRLMIHQGSNEGFRALFAHVYAGPDRGRGVVILSNSDARAVACVAEVSGLVLRGLGLRGIRAGAGRFDAKGLSQEQVVNQGYKALLFDFFEEDLPGEIPNRGPVDPLSAQSGLVGAQVVSVSNQRFARAENLVNPHTPVFDPELFERQGKTMDSWETVRHNVRGVDHLVLAPLKSVRARYVRISTRFHDGNQAPAVRLSGREGGGEWTEFLPSTPLNGHAELCQELKQTAGPFSEIRVEIFPDGGLTRLELFETLAPEFARRFSPKATSVRYADAIPRTAKPLSLPYSLEPDSPRVLSASNEHYGPAAQVVSPKPPLHMFDGLESARSRTPGHFDEVVLGWPGPTTIDRLIFDFTYFVNNNPLEVSAEASSDGGATWQTIVPRSRVKAFAGNRKEFLFPNPVRLAQLRVRTYPDGGINRIRFKREVRSR